MAKYATGLFIPKNPAKYVGNKDIIYRSSWEYLFFSFLDNHPNVLQWSSESLRIPYFNPIKGKQSVYIPDVFMVYMDAAGQKHAELIEIKPSKEQSMGAAKSSRDKLMVVQNYAKWQAATQFCQMQGIKFRVLTELQLFQYTGGK